MSEIPTAVLSAIGFTMFHLSAVNLLLAREGASSGWELSARGAAGSTQLKWRFPPVPSVSLGPRLLTREEGATNGVLRLILHKGMY